MGGEKRPEPAQRRTQRTDDKSVAEFEGQESILFLYIFFSCRRNKREKRERRSDREGGRERGYTCLRASALALR